MCDDISRELNDAARRAYVRLFEHELPRAGRERGWPWTTRPAFEALVHGHLTGRTALPCSDLLEMVLAIEVGERLLAGGLCPKALCRCEMARKGEPAGDPERLFAAASGQSTGASAT